MQTIRTEEYLEVIYAICKKKKIAKVSEIKEKLDLSSLASVTEMVQKLDEKKLINYEKYYGVTLTEKGLSIAKELVQKHTAIENFLKIIGVKEEIAVEDACSIEHIITEESIEAISKFLGFLNKKENESFRKKMKQYINNFR